MSHWKRNSMITLLGALLAQPTVADEGLTLNIGLYERDSLPPVVWQPVDGKYELWVEDEFVGRVGSEEQVYIDMTTGILRAATSEKAIHPDVRICLLPVTGKRFVMSWPEDTASVSQAFAGGCCLQRTAGRYLVINQTGLKDYLAGVLHAESGGLLAPEFLKAMSVVSRTYAFYNMQKHKADAFHLCNTVHCQVYEGVGEVDSMIWEAVHATAGQVITDTSGNLIEAVYHANSGGRTLEAHAVWRMPIPYLQGRLDTFAGRGHYYTWKDSIRMYDWMRYLSGKTGRAISEFPQDTCMQRRQYYMVGADSLPTWQMRQELGLRSTLWSLRSEHGWVIFEGRGFGHGVGMSQESAYQMALGGYPYDEIIRFYYHNVILATFEPEMLSPDVSE